MNELQLITSREFNGYTLDCYIEPEQEDKGAFWATREQIGRLLGYANPRKSITVIHQRNKERLDKFCFRYQIDTPFDALTENKLLLFITVWGYLKSVVTAISLLRTLLLTK